MLFDCLLICLLTVVFLNNDDVFWIEKDSQYVYEGFFFLHTTSSFFHQKKERRVMRLFLDKKKKNSVHRNTAKNVTQKICLCSKTRMCIFKGWLVSCISIVLMSRWQFLKHSKIFLTRVFFPQCYHIIENSVFI